MATATKAKTSKKKKQQVTDVLLAWCIDRSGSMYPFTKDTIDGFNAYLEEQKAIEEGNAYLSMVLFDNTFQVPYVAEDVRSMEPLTDTTYYVGGSTALYDAVAVTIDGVEAWLANNDFDGKVLVTVWTDGLENASSLSLSALMDRIREKQDEGWTFSFLGAGGAAWTEGKQFASTVGVQNSTQVTATSSGVRASYAAMSKGATALRSTGHYAGTTSYLNEAVADTHTLASFGVSDAAEALAGTSNVEVDEEED